LNAWDWNTVSWVGAVGAEGFLLLALLFAVSKVRSVYRGTRVAFPVALLLSLAVVLVVEIILDVVDPVHATQSDTGRWSDLAGGTI